MNRQVNTPVVIPTATASGSAPRTPSERGRDKERKRQGGKEVEMMV